jgi:hypothetical protein
MRFLMGINALWNERTDYLYRIYAECKAKNETDEAHARAKQIMECDYILRKVLELVGYRWCKSEILSKNILTKTRAKELVIQLERTKSKRLLTHVTKPETKELWDKLKGQAQGPAPLR